MTLAERIAQMLGGRPVLKRDVRFEVDLVDIIDDGMPTAALEALARESAVRMAELQEIISIDRSTFRRRAKSESKLKVDESDRVVRVARVAAIANTVFGESSRASAWLHTPNMVLGNRVPIKLLSTDLGARQVEDILGRIEHGVFS